jgi:hypothetical protein
MNGASFGPEASGISARAMPATKSASRMVGKLRITSPTRMMKASSRPPTKPATRPSATPSAAATKTAPPPIRIDTRAP